MSRESLISKINNDKMNKICFDCGVENPVFVSVNNGIFLCDQCATVHLSFPQGISIIENNDLNSLSEQELKFLAFGGNTKLNDFILDEFPKLENYTQKLLYKTRGMDYYRKRLDFKVNGGVEPKKPSQIVACQLIPDNYYSRNNYSKTSYKKFEPKTRTYKPEEYIKSRKFNINKKNDENEFDEEKFFRDPFLNENKFGMEEGNMFKKFFGDDFFGQDEDLLGFGGKKPNPTQRYNKQPVYQEKPKQVYKSTREPQDNLSKRAKPELYQNNKAQQRPLTASNPIFVPSRKHKYIKKEEQINNNQNNQQQGNLNQIKYNKNLNYQNENKTDKYNPFKRRDSTDLIILPGNENNNNTTENKRKQKKDEIPAEFHKRASGLGQIAETINENEEKYLNQGEDKSDNENNSDFSAELDKIPENNTHKPNPNDIYDENKITFKNSIRNKYKKRKSEQIMEDMKKEEKLRNSKPNNNNNINRKSSNKGNGFRSRKNTDENNNQFDKKFARRLSKMKITSENWNINQLGDISTYPDAMQIEE